MKNRITCIYYLVCFSFFIVGCSTDNLDTYNSQDNIYFTWADERPIITGSYENQYIDSLGVSFAFTPTVVTDSVFKVPVSVQGKVSNVDRTVKVKVREESTAIEGVHFNLPKEVTFRANAIFDSIPVTLYRTPEMKSESFTIVMELESNEDFLADMEEVVVDELNGIKRSYTVFELTVNDILETPFSWFAGYLGDFSAKKMMLMSEVLGIPLDYYVNQVALAEVHYHGMFMQRYLNEQEAAGNTIYEEDGTAMIMGPYVQ